MKIITITFHLADNYGAVLQAYALQKFLLSNKSETRILNYDNKNISGSYRLFSRISRNPIKIVSDFAYDLLCLKANIKKKSNFSRFRRKMILTNYFCKAEEVTKIYNDGDTYIVGSDQVWNSKWTGGTDDIYTLNFGEGHIKKISYAASSGDVETLKKNIDILKERFNKFDFISVRENRMKEYLDSVLDKPVDVVLDPTLLLNAKDWSLIAGSNRIEKEKYIFTYEAGNPNQLYYDVINRLSEKTGLKVIYFAKNDYKHKYKFKKESYYTAGPAEWINLLLNAEYIVTTSFHGTALGTLLNKEIFIVLSTLPDRLTTLLNTLEINDRIIKEVDEVDKLLNNKIDWIKVNNLLKKERKKSIDWLLKAIESEKYEQK